MSDISPHILLITHRRPSYLRFSYADKKRRNIIKSRKHLDGRTHMDIGFFYKD
jgi:hypothetical protein